MKNIAKCMKKQMLILNQVATIGDILSVDLPKPRARLQLAHDPHSHNLRSSVLEFLSQKQMRPVAAEAA